MNSNLSKLLPKVWWLIVLVVIGGFFVGYKTDAINDSQLAGGLVALYSLALIWGGLVAGYQTKANEK